MELVWAKLRFCPYWPAKICAPPPEIGIIPRRKLCVFFFGSKNYGFVPEENIVDYAANRKKYIKKGRGKQFENAVASIDEYITDPIVFASNGQGKIDDCEIVVKKERNTIIKQEIDIEQMPYETDVFKCTNPAAQIKALKMEKEKLIKEMVVLKSAHQKVLFQLEQKHREIIKLNQMIKKVSIDVTVLSDELKNLKSEQVESDKTISNLMEEKRLMTEQLNKMQEVTEQSDDKNMSAEMTKSLNEEYEVETIRDHKIWRKERKFLVSWKGYSSKHDLWVKERDLNCPIILGKYLKRKGLINSN